MNLIRHLLETDPIPPPAQRVYTTGYQGREVTDLPALLTSLDAVLVDISLLTCRKTVEMAQGLFKTTAQAKIPARPESWKQT